MHDLLKEHDFIEKNKFNPWRRVMICCCIAMIQASVFFVFIASTNTFSSDGPLMLLYILWIIINIVFPLVLTFVMIFQGKKMIKLPLKTLFLSLLCLGSVYSLVFVLGELIDSSIKNRDTQIDDVFIAMSVGVAYFVVFCVTVLPVAHYKAKRMKL